MKTCDKEKRWYSRKEWVWIIDEKEGKEKNYSCDSDCELAGRIIREVN